jgi:hypothetical protein
MLSLGEPETQILGTEPKCNDKMIFLSLYNYIFTLYTKKKKKRINTSQNRNEVFCTTLSSVGAKVAWE